MYKLFAVTAPGLQAFTAAELTELELLSPTVHTPPSPGGVDFTGGLEAVYRANLWLRTANRVLVRLGEFYAAAFSKLRKETSHLPWEDFLVPGQPVALRVTCKKSRLYHSTAVAERVAAAIGDRLGKLPPQVKFDQDAEGESSQLVIVRLSHDHCTISIDSSGALLHRRGYRLGTAKAPLRETLVAGLLRASGWDHTSPLADPFCGSGTIPIEAALVARNIPPGHMRGFTFMNWPKFDRSLWDSLLLEAGGMRGTATPRISASDRDKGAIEIAQANAARAGVDDAIDFSWQSISALSPVGTGWVVTNPPYGMRVSKNKDLRNLYAQFGNVLRRQCPGWQVAFLSNSYQLIGSTGLDLDTSLSFQSGGSAVKVACGSVPNPENAS